MELLPASLRLDDLPASIEPCSSSGLFASPTASLIDPPRGSGSNNLIAS